MKKIAIVHPSLNFLGGAEKVSIKIIENLKKENKYVSLFTLDETDWRKILELFDVDIRPDEECVANKYQIKELRNDFLKNIIAFKTYLVYISRNIKNFDLVINTYGDLDVLNIFANICYTGFPFSLSFLFPDIAPYPLKNPLIQRSYYMIWKTLVPFCNKKRLIFLANSSFTKNLLYCIYGTKIPIFILYPPCETKKYSKNIDLNDKKNIVIIVSRFSQGKRLELIPEIVRRVKRWNFALVGSTFNKSGEILKSINKKIIEYKIQDRLNIFPNIPFIQLKKLLSESKVYLHLMKNEPFGMSTIEAMASGCVPIIHMSGGGWHDIFMEKQGYYGYAYKKYSDIINYLKLLEDNETYKRLANRSKNRALDFDESMFNKKFIYYINKFTNNKFYSKKS